MVPNPSKDWCKIVFSLPKDKSGELKITDSNGREMFSQQVSANSTEKVLDISGFSNGIYFYTIKVSGERSMHGKITVIK